MTENDMGINHPEGVRPLGDMQYAEDMPQKKTAAIVLAAGQGKRMHSKVAKQYMLLDGKPVLYYSLKALQDSFVEEIILVTGQGEQDYCRTRIVEEFGFTKVAGIVEGGRERYHSVYAGLCALQGSDAAYIMIHDGARPFLDQDILERLLEAVSSFGACVAGMPSKDTVKIADRNGFAKETPDRTGVWTIQTPQAFTHDLISRAYKRLMEQETELLNRQIHITDDAMVVELLGDHPVRLVEGSYRNIKITTPEDYLIAECFLGKR